MKWLFTLLITIYQKVFSLDTGLPRTLGLIRRPICRFYPTCSEYMKQSIEKYGVFKGIRRGLKRLSRCRPGVEPGVDFP